MNLGTLDGGGSSAFKPRPYRSHVQPACYACRRRKTRCTIVETSALCLMCQNNGSECIFPARTAQVNSQTRHASSGQKRGRRDLSPGAHHSLATMLQDSSTTLEENGNASVSNERRLNHRNANEAGTFPEDESRSALLGRFAEAGDEESHIIGPAVASDIDVLESYLSNTSSIQRKNIVRHIPSSNSPASTKKSTLFTTVQTRPLGFHATQSISSQKCEIIEQLIAPHANILIDLFFHKVNLCFPILDETSFRKCYVEDKGLLSPSLLSNIYANALAYWRTSGVLSQYRCPDHRFIWVQATEAMHSEILLSPGVSTVISILINACGRPSLSIIGNNTAIGVAIALCNARGLNRDPSSWQIPPSEKTFRKNTWWLLVIHDRWSSLATGTPLQINRKQFDVPGYSLQREPNGINAKHSDAATLFYLLVTLTEVLGRCLEFVYDLRDRQRTERRTEILDLRHLLRQWEESLDEHNRRLLLGRSGLHVPGSANLRMAYLAVKFLLERLEGWILHMDLANNPQIDDRALGVAQDIVQLVRDLGESHVLDFWIPFHSSTLTSVATFLMKCAIETKNTTPNTPLALAQDFINALKTLQNDSSWDLADHCLARYGDVLDKLGGLNNDAPAFDWIFEELLDIDDPYLQPGYDFRFWMPSFE